MTTKRSVCVFLLAGVLLVMAGCGVGTGDPEDNLDADLGLVADAEYVVVDLANGKVDTLRVAPDLNDPRYTDTDMVFRRIDAPLLVQGILASQDVQGLADDPDERSATADDARASRSVTMQPFYIGVMEVTRAQWLRLGGSTAWAGEPLAGGDAGSQALPACNLSAEQVMNLLGSLTLALRLPTPEQWELACRGADPKPFFWGTGTEPFHFSPYAVVRPMDGRSGADGPQVVRGNRQGNDPWGLYDTHGNVWELVRSAQGETSIRGGSWNDPVFTARASNAVAISSSVPHPLVGLRLVINP